MMMMMMVFTPHTSLLHKLDLNRPCRSVVDILEN